MVARSVQPRATGRHGAGGGAVPTLVPAHLVVLRGRQPAPHGPVH